LGEEATVAVEGDTPNIVSKHLRNGKPLRWMKTPVD